MELEEENPEKPQIILIGCSPPLLQRVIEAETGLKVVIVALDELPDNILDDINPHRIQQLVVNPLPQEKLRLPNKQIPQKFSRKVSDQYPKSKKRDTRFGNKRRRSF
ncbi:hypothetical protein IPM19_00595 [bacterium]|nr:MAG: hypothetical protein IPM19_00595 [bacterium]